MDISLIDEFVHVRFDYILWLENYEKFGEKYEFAICVIHHLFI